MKLLIEGQQYDGDAASRVREIVGDMIAPLDEKDGKVSLNYVGYLYNPSIRDSVFILPKVLVDESGRPFGKDSYSSSDLIDIDQTKVLEEKEREFIYKFAVWLYRALCVYKKKNDDNGIIYSKQLEQVGGKERSGTFLEVILDLQEFNSKHQDFFMTIAKNIHSGYNKINWTRTISRETAFVQNGAPVYLHPINKKRQINFDEELLVIFFSILRYIHDWYGFPVKINLCYELITGEQFKQYLNGFGESRLRQIKYKYFSDIALRLWNLCYKFFDWTKMTSTASDKRECLIAKNFNIVFEAIIDELVGDGELPDGLKNQPDGKRLDHLYLDKSLTDIEDIGKKVFYIGDSKYYELRNKIPEESVYKQFTYARNLMQWNISLHHESLACDGWKNIIDKVREEWRDKVSSCRDDETEGYDIVPNYFISARMADDLSFKEDRITPSNRKRFHLAQHFPDRLFDRDTLMISHYDVNFLYVIALYAKENDVLKQQWKQKVRARFRQEILSILNEKYNFYIMSGCGIKRCLHKHFKSLIGKIYKPYTETDKYLLALEKNDSKVFNTHLSMLQNDEIHIEKIDHLGT